MAAARIAAVVLALCPCAIVAQQPPTVTISVLVSDQSGAVIPHAGFRATDEATGKSYDAAADSWGRAELQIPPGKYTLRVQSPGFKTWVRENREADGSISETVALNVGSSCSGACGVVIAEPKIPIERQQLELELALEPIHLLPLSSKPLHRKFHWP
ncbi:MAG TPA: carboxypeptidase-like regulatory domain-containing protein [Terracidiphilus sp.]|jgi:hypothetical protein|nr:carboxypeptidase-like regulatory domain-containing protein [Terracidiphilus sp.]